MKAIKTGDFLKGILNLKLNLIVQVQGEDYTSDVCCVQTVPAKGYDSGKLIIHSESLCARCHAIEYGLSLEIFPNDQYVTLEK